MDLQAWIVSANMGLGHQRATYPLRDMAYNGVLLFGEDESLKKEKGRTIFRNSYETYQGPAKYRPSVLYLFSLLENCKTYLPITPGAINPVRRCRSGLYIHLSDAVWEEE